MENYLITLNYSDSGEDYKAIRIGDRIYRLEKNSENNPVLSEWRFYGGAIEGIDFKLVEDRDYKTGEPIAKPKGTFSIHGIEKHAGKNRIEEIADPNLERGDYIVASPIRSPKLKDNSMQKGQIARWSATVKSVQRLDKVNKKDLEALLK